MGDLFFSYATKLILPRNTRLGLSLFCLTLCSTSTKRLSKGYLFCIWFEPCIFDVFFNPYAGQLTWQILQMHSVTCYRVSSSGRTARQNRTDCENNNELFWLCRNDCISRPFIDRRTIWTLLIWSLQLLYYSGSYGAIKYSWSLLTSAWTLVFLYLFIIFIYIRRSW